MEQVIDYIYASETINFATKKATLGLRNIGLALLPMFFVLTQAWNFASTSIKNLEQGKAGVFRLSEIIRASVLWLLVLSYIPVFAWISDLCGIINRVTVPDSLDAASGKEDYDLFIKQMLEAKAKDDEGNLFTMSIEFLTNAGQSIINAISGIFNAATWSIIQVLRFVIEGVSIYIAKVFYSIGPLVIAFSVLPPFKDKLDRWFGAYITVLLVPVTLNTLDFMVWTTMEAATTGTFKLATNPVADLVFGLTVIIIYVLSFWITSFIAGGSDAGKVLSTGVAFATTAAGVISKFKGFGSGGGGEGVGSSGGSDAASTAKNVIEG